jgi:hypothetical protein
MQNARFAKIRVRAERKAGALLAKRDRAKPRGSNQHQDRSRHVTDPQPLRDLGMLMGMGRMRAGAPASDKLVFRGRAAGCPMPQTSILVAAYSQMQAKCRSQVILRTSLYLYLARTNPARTGWRIRW